MRTGIFGGTFNPVHNGHLLLARVYIAALSLDRLLVIPTRVPPHKTDDSLIAGAHRLEMCRRAFADLPNCEVSDLELRRAEKSYTVDTLETLHARLPDDELYFIMGSDMFLTLTHWKDWARIFELAVMCVGAREPGILPDLEKQRAALERAGARCRIVNLDPLPISSTQVRARAQAGEDIRPLVPDAVADYIVKNGLYRPQR